MRVYLAGSYIDLGTVGQWGGGDLLQNLGTVRVPPPQLFDGNTMYGCQNRRGRGRRVPSSPNVWRDSPQKPSNIYIKKSLPNLTFAG